MYKPLQEVYRLNGAPSLRKRLADASSGFAKFDIFKDLLNCFS